MRIDDRLNHRPYVLSHAKRRKPLKKFRSRFMQMIRRTSSNFPIVDDVRRILFTSLLPQSNIGTREEMKNMVIEHSQGSIQRMSRMLVTYTTYV